MTGVTETTNSSSVNNFSNGFNIGLDYSVSSSSVISSSSPVDVTWTSTRNFSVGSAQSVVDGTGGNIGTFSVSVGGSASGTLTVTVSILDLNNPGEAPLTVPNSTLSSNPAYQFTSVSGTVSNPFSWETEPPPPLTLAAGSYALQLSSDLNITALSSGATIEVDPGYGSFVDPVPEPSSLALAVFGLGTFATAGLRRRLRRT